MVGWGWFRRKAVGLVLVFLMMVTVVSGCGSNQEPAKNQSIIKVVLDGEPDHLDYLLSQARIGRTVSDPINATLVTFDSDMQIKPYLAEKWEIVDDTTIRFDLVQGAKFHNGREVVADDVKKTIERIQDPATGSFLRPQLDMVASVDVVDKSTFDLKLKAAYAPMLSVLTRVPIIPIEAAGEMKTKPIGAGPFKFVRWDKGQQVVLEKFGDFFIKGQPKVDQLVFKFVAEYSAAISALETGEVDAVLYVNPVDVSRLKQKGDIYVVDTTLMGFQYVAFVVDRAPWNNKLLRQAVALAIDRDALIQKV
ncbi:MAG TPA: ABC transporter substrate-binding protein, partial [Firmicutes bacterium]|nr:ABC transporter substrate-binding protein [Bacillota bacterium]